MGQLFWLVGIVAALAILALLFRLFALPWLRGKRGDAQVNLLARTQLDPEVYHLVPDVALPAADGAARIDHVIVSRYGVFVIETQNLKGSIYGHENDPQWIQQLFGKRVRFQNPLRQTLKHIRTLAQLARVPESSFIPVVVFADDSTFKTALPGNVVCFKGLIEFIKGHQEALVQDGQVPGIVSAIEACAGKAHPSPRKQGRNGRKNRAPAKADAEGVVCPTCGKAMVVRTGRRDGNKFWGCTAFPACKGVRKWGETS